MEQQTEEWYQARAGMITASRFGDIMSPRGLTKTADDYLNALAVQRLGGTMEGRSLDGLPAIEHGHTYEPDARRFYQLSLDIRIQQVGLLTRDDWPGVGGSPDGLVDDPAEDGPGGVEIKCPYNSSNHVNYLLGHVPSKYDWQMQGLMWLTKRDWWDFVSYDPRMPENLRLYRRRIRRDLDKHENLEARLKRFGKEIDKRVEKLRELNG